MSPYFAKYALSKVHLTNLSNHSKYLFFTPKRIQIFWNYQIKVVFLPQTRNKERIDYEIRTSKVQ